jgi:hypothetical protein
MPLSPTSIANQQQYPCSIDVTLTKLEIELRGIKLRIKLQAVKEAVGDLARKLDYLCELVTKGP